MNDRRLLIEPVATSARALRCLAYRDPQNFPVFLESSATGPLGRYSILAAFPQASLGIDRYGQLQAQGLQLGASAGQNGFLGALQSAWQQARCAPELPAQAPTLPFTGGWMVFLSYEMAAEVEPQLRLPMESSLPAAGVEALRAWALRIPAAVVIDQQRECAWCVAEAGRADLLAALQEALQTAASATPLAAGALPPLALEEEDPERFKARVLAALEYIRAGDIYQANLSRPWRGRFASAADEWLPAALYERLRVANPAPFAAFAQYRGWCLLSSSPERLVRVAGGQVETRPIAGTRPRSRQSGEDAREIAALIAHPKERAEHVMLVDLERNDLGRICQAGSVVADEIMVVESYAHVHHIVSNVSGRLRAGLTPIDVLRAVFPGGTITGCPKFRCMQIIAELEGEPRGAYTGGIGYLNHDGSMDFNILIRTLTLQDQQLEFRAGAGIVADSSWERELEETRAKARGLLAALRD